MEKSKLGVSVGLFGAALYFTGIISIFPLVILAGYVLLFENNEWLRKTAVKAVAVVLFFTILSAFIGLMGNISSLLIEVVSLFRFGLSFDITVYERVLSICRLVISFLQALFLLMLGFKALNQGDVGFSFVDNTIRKHIHQ